MVRTSLCPGVLSLLTAILTCSLSTAPGLVAATDVVVTNANDDGAGSLRQAIRDSANGDTITFDTGFLPATITLSTGELAITRNITIAGPGADKLNVSGGDASRVFNVSATVIISGLTVSHGRATGSPAQGGAIRNSGDLVLRRVTITSSRAEATGSTGDDAYGGGLFNTGTCRLDAGTVTTNTAQGGAMTGNYGGEGGGGGIANEGQITLTGGLIANNLAKGGSASSRYGGSGLGGGVANLLSGTMAVSQTVLTANKAQGGASSDRYGGTGYGGAVYNAGAAAIMVASVFSNASLGGTAYQYGGEGDGGGLYNTASGALLMHSVPVTGNIAAGTAASNAYCGSGEGGGVMSRGSLTVTNSNISGNIAQGATGPVAGGATAGGVSALGRLRIESSTLCDNKALGGKGTYWTYGYVGGDAEAGALYSYAGATQDQVVISSTLCSNRAVGGQGDSAADAYGGATYSYYTLTLQNSLIIGNQALGGYSSNNGGGGDGGGGGLYGLGALRIRESTVISNLAQGGAGGGYSYGGGARGGGVLQGYGGAFEISQSAILSNTARGGDSAASRGGSAYGGGFSDSYDSYSPTVRIVNVTLHANRALKGAGPTVGASALGGGVSAGASRAEISFATITANTADDAGAGLYSTQASDDQGPWVRNSIFFGNAAPSGPDMAGNVQSRGYNLIGSLLGATLDISGAGNTGDGNVIGVDPKLGPLSDNGGRTWTRALAGWPNVSPAVNAGNPGVATDVSGQTVLVDQRGFTRPYAPCARADIGAYELQSRVCRAYLPAASRGAPAAW